METPKGRFKVMIGDEEITNENVQASIDAVIDRTDPMHPVFKSQGKPVREFLAWRKRLEELIEKGDGSAEELKSEQWIQDLTQEEVEAVDLIEDDLPEITDPLTKAYKSIQALCDAAVKDEALEALGAEAFEGLQELKETIANLMMPPQFRLVRVFLGQKDITELIRRRIKPEENVSKAERTFMALPDDHRKAITAKFLEFLHETITLEELEEWIVVKGPFNMPEAKELVELLKGNDKLPEQTHPMCGPIHRYKTGDAGADQQQKTPYAVDCEADCGKSYITLTEVFGVAFTKIMGKVVSGGYFLHATGRQLDQIATMVPPTTPEP